LGKPEHLKWLGAVALLLALGLTPEASFAGGGSLDSWTPGTPSVFREYLVSALDGRVPREDIHLFVECALESGYYTLEVFGRGAGIWGGRRQFELSQAQVTALLQALLDGGFPELKEVYGGDVEPENPPRPDAARSALELICQVEASIGGARKRTIQFSKGERSAELLGLASALVDISREPAHAGIEPPGLAEALQGVGDGALIPEALTVTGHLKPARHPDSVSEGFLFQVRGRSATSRRFEPSSGYGPVHRLELSGEEFERFGAELAKLAGEGFPQNLWLPSYMDLSIAVLGHSVLLQARDFASLTPTTHGERQRAFEMILGELVELHRRVMAEGVVETGD
jgi:hypothetical protein